MSPRESKTVNRMNNLY